MNFLFALYPLQVRTSDLAWNTETQNNSMTAIVITVIIVVILTLVIINSRKGSGGGGGGGGGGGKLFSSLSLRRIARNIGLNYEQIRMLEYVFKTDEVLEPQKSLVNPALLDRHFRRAYRAIETSSKNDQEMQYKHAVLFSVRNILENSSLGKISSTKQLKEDMPLSITPGRDKIKVNVVYSQGENLIVDVPKNVLGTQIKIAKGTRISVLFFTKSNKGFTFETRVVGYSTMHGRPVMQLAHSNNLRFLSQRRFRRRNAAIACTMNLVYVEGSGKKQKLVVDKRRMQGNIVDISVGGCSIKTTGPAQVGARFKIEFSQAHGDVNVAALGQVLRSNKTGINTILHVKFLRVTRKSMNIINAFVYEYANE